LSAFIALALAVPVSTSPDAALYPEHRVVFGPGQASTAATARMHLLNARLALDRATAAAGDARSADVDDALRNLAEARKLLRESPTGASGTRSPTNSAALSNTQMR
jgi:hypothetical protein